MVPTVFGPEIELLRFLRMRTEKQQNTVECVPEYALQAKEKV